MATAQAGFVDGFNYIGNGDGTCYVSGYYGPGGAVSIPDTLTDLLVTGIGENAFSLENSGGSVTSVTMSPNVTDIGFGAFENCTTLANITIGTGVTVIEGRAFGGCTALTSVSIPDNVTSLGSGEYGVFEFCGGLTNVTIGAGVTNTDAAFGDCTNLSSVTIGDHVSEIGSGSFLGCTALPNIAFPNSVTSIGENAFDGCTALTNVMLDTNVTSIEDYAFEGCSALTSLKIPNSVNSIGGYAFEQSGLTNVIIPEGVEGIDVGTFVGCSNLTSITIPDSVSNIDNYAFQDCISLPGVMIDTNLDAIFEYAFDACTALTNITIPDSVTYIGTYVFANCTHLTSATIGAGIEYIGDFDFYGCTALTNIIFGTNVTTIGNSAFSQSGLTSITIPDTVTNELGFYVFSNCLNLASATTGNGVDSIEYYDFYGCTALTNIIFGTNVTGILDYSFASCTALTSVTIPDSVYYIGPYAFAYDTGLTNVTIPEGVETIDDDAFYGCTALTSITIPDTVTIVGDNAFAGCSGLTNIIFNGSPPSPGGPNVFAGDTNLTVYYLPGAEGWSSTFDGVLTALWILAPDFGAAVNATNLNWATTGDTSWFVETNVTRDGVSAAQSGIVTGAQSSTLQTTVTGPGTLTFWWKTSASDYNFDLEFALDGTDVDDNNIYDNGAWVQESAVTIPAGQHTLAWTAYANGSTDPGNAGWLDEVQFTAQAAPVSVSLDFSISRQQGFRGNLIYNVQPNITSISPIPVTTNLVESPDGYAFSEVLPGNSFDVNDGNPASYGSLDEAIYACTNGPWTLYINQGDPSEHVFHFNVSISGLTPNVLAPVNILVPANNAVNVATNTPIQWSGPANATYLATFDFQIPSYTFIGSISLPGTTTNWPSPPAMPYGTNDLEIEYLFLNSTNITFTTPVDGSMNPVSSWSTEGDLYSLSDILFVVGAPAPLPVKLTGSPPQTSGGNFQFGFQTLAGRPETIQVSTNLGGAWIDVTNFIGDGSAQQFTFPTTNAPGEYFRVVTQ